jgi:hypothetical protein
MKKSLAKFFALMVVLSMIVTPVSARSFAPDKPGAKTSTAEPSIYLVRFSDPPLALYHGGINTLRATSPVVTGVRKLNVHTEASQAYLGYLAINMLISLMY